MSLNKIIFPLVLFFIGICLFIFSITGDQNSLFKLGAGIILITSIVIFLSSAGIFTKGIRMVIALALGAACVLLSYLDYNSIQEPLKFKNEKEARFAQITQRLKDIREAQKGYKNVHKKYASTFDSLIAFIDTGKVPVIKASGTIPDGMNESEAIKKGYYKKEILQVDAKENIFNQKYMDTRNTKYALRIDSLEYIPTTNAEKFEMKTGTVEKNNVDVPTLEVIAPNQRIFSNWKSHFYANLAHRKFGSSTDPLLNGNWE